MIEGVVGYPGTGKTYYALWRAHKEMKRGRSVYSNFSIDGAKRITPQEMFDIEAGAFVILDEAQNWFGSRNWKDFGDRYMEFFSQTRKKEYGLLWLSQDVSSVDKTIRDRTHLIHDMNCYLKALFGRPAWFTITTYYGAKNIGKDKHKAQSKMIFFNKKIANSYDTHEIIRSRDAITNTVKLSLTVVPEIQNVTLLEPVFNEKDEAGFKLKAYFETFLPSLPEGVQNK